MLRNHASQCGLPLTARCNEEDACWQAFRVFDRDGNGTISQKESKSQKPQAAAASRVLGALACLKRDLHRLAEVLASDDVQGKFHKAWVQQRQPTAHSQILFFSCKDLAATCLCQSILHAELVLPDMIATLLASTPLQTKELLKQVDTNGDGEIDFQEFMEMMRS